MKMRHLRIMMTAVAVVGLLVANVTAQSPAQKQTAKPTTQKPNLPPAPPVPAGYVIGPDDVLTIVVMDDQSKMSGNFTVRPDGKIVMLQIDDIVAAGLKPEELKQKIKKELLRFYDEPVPEVFVQVTQMKSRWVYISGAVKRPGQYPLTSVMTIAQLITIAGDVEEFADKKKILVISGTQLKPNGEPVTWIVNYDDVKKGRNLVRNNIVLNPGDQVIVPGG